MVQGPISKYHELQPELNKEHVFKWTNIKFGIQLMLWGMFKKLVIADRIGVIVDNIFYKDLTAYGLTTVLGLVFYGIHLYCDFSGGIDIIRGVSECFDIKIKENFNQPFFSKSLGEFWRRWHMSLGQWMKDYVFYPVSMSKIMNNFKMFMKKKTDRKTANRLAMGISDIIVFSLVGIWHGTGTNFWGWGLYNGIILAISAVLAEKYSTLKRVFKINDSSIIWKNICIVRTFCIVTIGWIFDCANTLKGSFKILFNALHFKFFDTTVIMISKEDAIVFLLSCIVLLIIGIIHERKLSVREFFNNKPFWIQLMFWTLLIQVIACFGKISSAGGFMYENF